MIEKTIIKINGDNPGKYGKTVYKINNVILACHYHSVNKSLVYVTDLNGEDIDVLTVEEFENISEHDIEIFEAISNAYYRQEDY